MAVSGGVDSVVLLDILASSPQPVASSNQITKGYQLPATGYQLIVAHFDHGIRADSHKDREFVEQLAETYQLPFVFAEGKLGADASEALARKARYEFLEKVRAESGAAAIITAHHQDDLLETAIINLLRGTGRKGLTSLKSTGEIKRPLLGFSKQEIKNYAVKNKLSWREDPTNTDTKYLRNYVRHELLPKIDRQKFLKIIFDANAQNQAIDKILKELLPASAGQKLSRQDFKKLPDEVAKELMAAWLRQNGRREFDAPMIKRLTAAAQTAHTGKKFDAGRGWFLRIEKDKLALLPPER